MVSLSTSPTDSPRKDTQQVVLQNISWQTYQALLSDMGDHRSSQLAYDRGVLEITMPSDLHEFIKHLLERIVTALTEELNFKIRGIGSVTLDREDLEQGVEPDAGFYIQNASQIRGRKIDLINGPSPDLVVEVDITSSSSRRLGIYRSLKVPEVWRCTEKTIQINLLQNGKYVHSEYSAVFPMISAAIIKEFLEQGKTSDDDNAVIRSLRRWITEQQQN